MAKKYRISEFDHCQYNTKHSEYLPEKVKDVPESKSKRKAQKLARKITAKNRK